jgi:hypothetical protein
MVTFMDIVAYLKLEYVLMENVVDILKFADGYLRRYALSSLVAMNYQARIGIVVAGCYGLPQFRMCASLWGSLSSMVCFMTSSNQWCLALCFQIIPSQRCNSLFSDQLCLAL